MNYYPYYNFYPTLGGISNMASTGNVGLFGKLLGGARGIGWSSLLGNASKAIGVINQTIPVVKQVTPMFKNAKTMFKVMNEFKKTDTPTNNVSNKTKTTVQSVDNNVVTENVNSTVNNGPTFFV